MLPLQALAARMGSGKDNMKAAHWKGRMAMASVPDASNHLEMEEGVPENGTLTSCQRGQHPQRKGCHQAAAG